MTLPKSSIRVLDGLEAKARRALEILDRLGVDHADVGAATGRELEVTVRRGKVELVKEAQSSGLSARVIRKGRVASSSTTDLSDRALERFCAQAVEMATLAERDRYAVPPTRRELVKSWPDLDLYDPRTDRIKADRAIKLALAGEAAAFKHDKRITSSEGASFSRTSGHSVFATSTGFCGRKAGTYQWLAVQVVADDEGGKKRNGAYWTGGRFFVDLESPRAIGAEAAHRAVRSLGAHKLETGTYPVVFDKDAARGIIGLVASCVVGDAVYRQRSYLQKKLGKRIGSKHVTLYDDPLLARGPGSRPYDGEGRKVRRLTVARGGVLKSFLLDTYSARRLKMKPTGSATGGGGIPHSSTSNFFLAPGRSKPESLLKGIDRGLYVTRMMGFGFDPASGNFSRGAEGFLIEDGELGAPIGEITISRNLDDLLKGIDRVANDLEHRTSVSSPSFRVDAMTVGGS